MKSNSIKVQKLLVTVSVALFLIKLTAWYITNSVAILTDALESIVNVIAGFVGLYSIILSSKPKDKEHPYGHGKVEFLSSAIEGILIIIAGFIIIYEASNNLFHPHELKKLDFGILLIGSTALINFVVGHYCYVKGRKENSPILVAGGSHLKSDTYSTLGLLLGIGLLMFTKLAWIDSIAAYIFAAIIIFTGYKIIRRSVAGIMDESDESIIQDIVQVLNQNRNVNWIDVHNMRVINYAGFFHIDCHLTVPYYINVNEAHAILDSLTLMFQKHFEDKVEFFIHIDGCLFSQCSICAIEECPVRQSTFQHHISWTTGNILSNKKHSLGNS